MNKPKKDDKIKEVKPYLVFRMCLMKCMDCKYCGYVWGSGHPNEGEIPYWVKQ